MIDYLEDLINEEKEFKANSYFGKPGRKNVSLFGANGPLLVTAPHATKHARFGAVKAADEYTGALAMLLAKKTDAGVLISSSYEPDSSHSTELSEQFIETLNEIAPTKTLILDLHGMKDSHPSGVCFGTAGKALTAAELDLIDLMVENLADYQPTINVPFSGNAPYTLTRYLRGITPALVIQVELAAKYRIPGRLPADEQVAFLEAFVNTVQEATSFAL